jgi:hypothetical protein
VSEFTNHNGILVHPEIYTYDYQGNTVDHVLPNHPDFPAAVEALKALVPEPFEWVSGVNGIHYRYHNGHVECCVRGVWTFKSLDDDAVFEAGRRYERERGQ